MLHPSSPETIGLIGAGLMGKALAERLCAAGFPVMAWDRDSARLAEATMPGVEAAEGAGKVAARCRRVIFSLPDSHVVSSVLAELENAWNADAIVVDTSTGEPAEAVRFSTTLAARGVTYLDATISGSSEQLRQGAALCMVGGEASAFAACAGLWEAFGRQTMHVGPSGAGAQLKLVTNLVLGLNRAALAEGLVLAEAMGLDRELTLRVLQASAAYSRIMDAKGAKMITGDFQPAARLSQHLKDVRLMLHAATDAEIALPLSETHCRLLERAEAAGWGDLDNSAIIKVLQRNP
jgi:3-hydroxyisobutyrate dehydrogenase-like beta-hydroxyacid dehydrogenase